MKITQDSTLILCIDRDNDVGEKTKIRGPIIGEENNFKAANALIMADPSDADANTIFAAVKLGKDMKNKDIVTITGDKKVGIKSDQEISRQLNIAVEKTGAKKAILVTDGAEDEFVIPIIQAKLDIVSVHRVIIHQSERLEGAYYVVKNFINNVVDDSRLAKVFIGLPAIAFILIAVFGAEGWRLILGALGVYLIIKGFKLEKIVSRALKGASESLEEGRVSFFLYVISIIFIFIGIGFGYNSLLVLGVSDSYTATLVFILNSFNIFFISGFLIWLGNILMAHIKDKLKVRYITYLAIFFSVIIISQSAASVLLDPGQGLNPVIANIIISSLVMAVSLLLEKFSR